MIIPSKFRATCRACGKIIDKGDLIQWERGEGSRHVTCADKPKTPCAMCGAYPAAQGNHHNTNCGFWTRRPHS